MTGGGITYGYKTRDYRGRKRFDVLRDVKLFDFSDIDFYEVYL